MRFILPLFYFAVLSNSLFHLSYGQSGIANQYFLDQGVERHPKVLNLTTFESSHWQQIWSGGKRKTVSIISKNAPPEYQPINQEALRITIPKGEHFGGSMEFNFKKNSGIEPEEMYFRYYIRLGDNWNPSRGGKFPGFGGTYGKAGWGGRPSNGTNGWSARGQFKGRPDGLTEIGYYCYHADMKGKYGSAWMWETDDFSGLEKNRWYCIEQFVKLNTVGSANGILKGWVDGRLVFEKFNIRFRDTPKLKIENIWVNIYHGGSWTAATEDSLYLDHLIIATDYIGPMKTKK